MPSSTETLATKPLPYFVSSRITTSTKSAISEAAQRAIGRIGEGAGLAVDHLGQHGQAAAGPVDADAHQGDADDGDDGAGDHRREERSSRLTNGAIRTPKMPAPMIAPKMPRRPTSGIAGHGHHRADRGEGHAHHHRQLDAEAAGSPRDWISVTMPQANRSALISSATCSRRELERAADDQRHGDGAGVHHQHVLQAEREQLGCGKHLVDGMD